MERKQDSRSWFTKIVGAIAIIASSSVAYFAGNKAFKNPMAGAISSGIIGGITLTTLKELQESKSSQEQIDEKTNTIDQSPIVYRTDHAKRIKSEQQVSTQSTGI